MERSPMVTSIKTQLLTHKKVNVRRLVVRTVRTYRVLSHFQTVNTTASTNLNSTITIVLGLQGEQQYTQAVVFLTDLPQWQVYLNLGGHSLE